MSDKKQRVNFGPLKRLLAGYGFVNLPADMRGFYKHTYQKGELYVDTSISFDPRDAPFNIRVMLGEGSTKWIERDWNSIALWRLVKAKSPNHYPEGKHPYHLDSPSDINSVLVLVCSDLSQFAQNFLSGDLTVFRRVRAEQTRNRKPYLIHQPGPDGRYITEIESESQKLLERYSKEE